MSDHNFRLCINDKVVKVTVHKIPAADSKENAELCRKCLQVIHKDVCMSWLCCVVCYGVVTQQNTTRLICPEKPNCLIG